MYMQIKRKAAAYQSQVIDDRLRFRSSCMYNPQNLYPWKKASAAKDKTANKHVTRIHCISDKSTSFSCGLQSNNFYINADKQSNTQMQMKYWTPHVYKNIDLVGISPTR